MAAAAEPTKIKGSYIGMTRAEVLALKPSDVDFFEEKHSHLGNESVDLNFTAQYDGAPRNIAWFVLKNDTVDSFNLRHRRAHARRVESAVELEHLSRADRIVCPNFGEPTAGHAKRTETVL
ncbi:hypothetical protein IVB12_07515 [Bradyrhizobium sp. 179]|uniref:hypothetical protein n=1 Tax=Bradyrhizobium sp. 179 TaxID=2782648 RepID=UPI001FFAE7DE|nr:hypothetical protein [Bradyrhizobium sp. 179]MCK1541832.1 hypothetical protein [Bradyrhizobium sp. 179]